MFDKALQTSLSPCWQALAKPLSRLGVQADHVTWAAWLLGMLAAVAIANAAFTLGLVLMLLSRAADALDGAVARINGASDRGGFLDIALDFSTLMYKQGRDPLSTPNKSFYFVGGLTEGGETLAAFVAMCLWPQHFATIAWVFAALCIATALTRLHHGWRHL
jgi:phosphatidylglycerophosphate synthase